MTDPELQGDDPVWSGIKRGHGHVYAALALIVVLAVALEPSWTARGLAAVAALAGGVFADCYAHLYLH